MDAIEHTFNELLVLFEPLARARPSSAHSRQIVAVVAQWDVRGGMCPSLEYTAIVRQEIVEHPGRIVRLPHPKGVMMSALDDDDSVDLYVSQALDGLGSAFFARRQLPLPVESLA